MNIFEKFNLHDRVYEAQKVWDSSWNLHLYSASNQIQSYYVFDNDSENFELSKHLIILTSMLTIVYLISESEFI